MSTGTCTVNGIQFYNGGWSGSYASTNAYAGKGWGTSYYVAIVKLTTPSFSGTSEKLTFNLSAIPGDSTAPSSVTLRCALCTADTNKDAYVGVSSDPTDAARLVSGTVSLTGLNSGSTVTTAVSIASGALKGGTAYYLYFYAASSTNGQYAQLYGTHTASVTYTTGPAAYVYNGSAWVAVTPYVYNGSAWVKAEPHLYSGSAWK